MKTRLLLGALSALAAGFLFSGMIHHDKWIYIDQDHFIVRVVGETCAGHSTDQGFYLDPDC